MQQKKSEDMEQKIMYTNSVAETVDKLIDEIKPVNIVVITDSNTAIYVYPKLAKESKNVADARLITVKSGDINKNIDSLMEIWRGMEAGKCTRKSLAINMGGGVITDMGGFAAATYKRGIKFINIPTTLLSAVDAAVGGKTGINFAGYKNEIGCFCEADAVIISTLYFETLNSHERRSGYAEMIKHGLIKSHKIFNELIEQDVEEIDREKLLELLTESVKIKEEIVKADPKESGIRKALNFGHTIGHAFEEHSLKHGNPISHGYAVAFGMITEVILSHLKLEMPTKTLNLLSSYIKEVYGIYEITCDDYPELISYMRHDKKNSTQDNINFTLLKDVGEPVINCTASEKEIIAALDIYRDLMGI